MRKSVTNGLTRNGARALVFVSIVAVSAFCASADTVVYLGDATMRDDAVTTGSIPIDSTFDDLSSWDIALAASNVEADSPDKPGDANQLHISSPEVALGSNPVAELLVPRPVTANAGGTINPANHSSLDWTSSSTATLILKPVSVLLFASGALVLALLWWRRQRAGAGRPRRA